jgi:hypothetical protein
MRRVFPSRPSPAMVVALLALFVALGGSGYAAVQFNVKSIKNGTLPGKKLKRNSVTGRQVKESTLATVPRAQRATLLAGQPASDFLPVGGTAADSQRLAGLAPTSFVRRECDQANGQNKGVVTITASPAFSATFTTVPGYNCSGQSIEARRLGMGRYEVRFNGSPSNQAVATSIVPGVSADMVSVLTPSTAGLFTVHILDPLPAPGAFVDHSFTLISL